MKYRFVLYITSADLNRHCFFVGKPTVTKRDARNGTLRAADCTRVGHSHTLSETIRRFYRGTPPAHSVPFAASPQANRKLRRGKRLPAFSPSPSPPPYTRGNTSGDAH